MRFPLFLFASAFALIGCTQDKAPASAAPPAAAAPAPVKPSKVTLLVTGHETGKLPDKAPRLLAQWKAEESWPDAIAISTGDSFAGAALSSHFFGAPTAEAMKAMQYKASALGNHDLDLGFDTLNSFRATSGITLLAANLKDKPNAEQPLKLAPSLLFTREGVKVGVIGFTSGKTLATTVSGRASGLELIPLEAAMGGALQSLTKDAPDVVVAVIDDCFTPLQKLLATHADWKVDLVVGSLCEDETEVLTGHTKFFSVGDNLTHYISATVLKNSDGTKTLTAARKPIVPTGAEDADLATLRERWQTKLDSDLGQKIGFSKKGYKQDAPQLRTLVATALKEETKADAALINRKGIRSELPPGSITRASVYSLIPFENAVVTLTVKGDVLTKLKSHPEAFIVGPAKIDAQKDYVLATTEYIYFGGDDLGLELIAPEPELSGQVWQTPVIAWLEKQGSTEKKPLEKMLK